MVKIFSFTTSKLKLKNVEETAKWRAKVLPLNLSSKQLFPSIGKIKREWLLQKFGISKDKKPFLDFEQMWFEKYTNNYDKFIKHQSIKNKILVLSFEGERHKLKMPVRGQRTRTNARTRRKRGVY